MVAARSSLPPKPLSLSLMRISTGMPWKLPRRVVSGTSTANVHGTLRQLGSTSGLFFEKKV